MARLPLSEDDSLRNLRLQVQALVNRYQTRKTLGAAAQEALAEQLRGVMARNPSLSAANYKAFLTGLLRPLGEDKAVSVLSTLGLWDARSSPHRAASVPVDGYRLEPPGSFEETSQAVQAVRNARSLEQAWNAIRPLLSVHEEFVHRSGDAYDFVRALDMCVRALCERYTIADADIQGRLFQWIELALQMDGDNPRLWMLWELTLRQSGYPQRAQWVLWEMTRRFPDQLPCRVELARLLAASGEPAQDAQARRLLQQVLRLDPDHLHAYSTLAQLAIQASDWSEALRHARRGLQIDPADGASAVLLASAYARRGEPGDLDTAIDHLQRFTSHYRGNPRAEGYLRDLQQRRRSMQQTDPAWRAFAESLRAWVSGAGSLTRTEDEPTSIDRLSPLPEALRQAAAGGRWDTDVLADYDDAVRQEFPLEIRVWRYLQTVHTDAAGEAERERARQAVELWLEAERKALGDDRRSWLSFLTRSWADVTASVQSDPGIGADWLAALLDRYQPLPPPLFA